MVYFISDRKLFGRSKLCGDEPHGGIGEMPIRTTTGFNYIHHVKVYPSVRTLTDGNSRTVILQGCSQRVLGDHQWGKVRRRPRDGQLPVIRESLDGPWSQPQVASNSKGTVTDGHA